MTDRDSQGYEVVPNYTPPPGPIIGTDDFLSEEPAMGISGWIALASLVGFALVYLAVELN